MRQGGEEESDVQNGDIELGVYMGVDIELGV